MYATAKSKKDEFWSSFSRVPGDFADSIPTFDRKLDTFFDNHFDAIIEEWDLITNEDIRHLKTKLDFVCYEVDLLVNERKNLESRIDSLKNAISELEGNL